MDVDADMDELTARSRIFLRMTRLRITYGRSDRPSPRPGPDLQITGLSRGGHLSNLWAMSFASVKGFLRADVPLALRSLWLDYHQAELCQDLDSVFVFRPDGIEIWCAIQNEKSYQKLGELCKPLEGTLQFDLYPTRYPREKPKEEDRNPPPSLMNNNELLSYLADPFARRRMDETGVEIPQAGLGISLKQRLMAFAEQTLESAERLKRYSTDLGALAWGASAPAADPGWRSRCRDVCGRHAREIEKVAQRLGDDLSRAFPRGERPEKPEAAEVTRGGGSVRERADQLAVAAEEAARRVYRFIYPERHTVGLEELRQPGLIAALQNLEAMAAGLQNALPPAKPR